MRTDTCMHARTHPHMYPYNYRSTSHGHAHMQACINTYYIIHMTITSHLSQLIQGHFYQLHRIKTICKVISTSDAVILVNSFIISMVDYCNSMHQLNHALPARPHCCLQSYVTNLSAEGLCSLCSAGQGLLLYSTCSHIHQAEPCLLGFHFLEPLLRHSSLILR